MLFHSTKQGVVMSGFTVQVLRFASSKFRGQFHCSNQWNLNCLSALMAVRKDYAIRAA